MKILFILVNFICAFNVVAQEITVGVLLNDIEAFDSYTLFNSVDQPGVYLINNCGEVINSWETERPGYSSYLLNNGNLVTTSIINDGSFQRPGKGGGIEIRSWNNDILWQYEFTSSNLGAHHDIEPLPNNNLLILLWEKLSREEAIALGRDSSKIEGELWPEAVFEIRPEYNNSNEFQIVWEWHLKDHLVQNIDNSLQNFGEPFEHPELIDINYLTRFEDDWIHANSLDFNVEKNEVIISSLGFNEFWIIDHSTTTLEAATHEGGNRNKGGDILFRWGNPYAYKRADSLEYILNSQHDVEFCAIHEDHVTVSLFNNNTNDDSKFSEVMFLDIPIGVDGSYEQINNSESIYNPTAPSFIFSGNPDGFLDSPFMSGVQVLPNNNFLVSVALNSVYVEYNQELKEVWKYKSPLNLLGTSMQGDTINGRSFKAIKYDVNDIIFDNLDVSIKFASAVDGENESICGLINPTVSTENILLNSFEVFPNPVIENNIQLKFNNLIIDEISRIQIYDTQGVLKYDKSINLRTSNLIDISYLNSGIHIIRILKNRDEISKKFVKI